MPLVVASFRFGGTICWRGLSPQRRFHASPCRGEIVGLNVRIRNALLVTCCALVATTVARAQSSDPIGDLLAQGPQSTSGPTAPMGRQSVARPIGAQDQATLTQALNSAK